MYLTRSWKQRNPFLREHRHISLITNIILQSKLWCFTLNYSCNFSNSILDLVNSFLHSIWDELVSWIPNLYLPCEELLKNVHNCNQFQVPSMCSDVIPPCCSSNTPSSWVRGGGVLVTGRPETASWNTEASWKTASNWMRGDGVLVLVRGRVAATFGNIASSRKRASWNIASWRSATWRVAALVRGGRGRATYCGWHRGRWAAMEP